MNIPLNLWYGPTVITSDELLEHMKYAAQIYQQSLAKQWTEQPYDPRILRPSMIGKPGLQLAAKRFFPEMFTTLYYAHSQDIPEEYEEEFADLQRRTQIFHMGDIWEADFYFHCKRTGIKILAFQQPVSWNGIEGTLDFILDLGNGPVLVDTKSYSAKYTKRLLSEGLTDTFGGVTQLAIYSACAGYIPSYLGVFCRDTCHFYLVPADTESLNKALTRAKYVVDSWNQISEWDDAFAFFKPPPPKKEYSNRAWTGRYLVPVQFYSCPSRHLIYEIVEDEGREYVVDYRYPDSMIEYKPELH